MVKVIWFGETKPPNVKQKVRDGEFDLLGVSSSEEVLGVLQEYPDSVLVLSHKSVSEAKEVFSDVRDAWPDVPCILWSENPPEGIEGEVIFDYVSAEDGNESLVDTIRSAVDRRSHTSYPVPEGEDERLAEVDEYSNLELSGEFDHLTRISQRHFDVDMALVGIVGDSHERFLSCHGAELNTLPREDTFCTHQILDERVLVVENIKQDPRFGEENPLLEKGMRFYAGASLLSPSGARIGSFCIIDGETRSLSDEGKSFLNYSLRKLQVS